MENIYDSFPLKGRLVAVVRRPDGSEERREVENVITTVGKYHVANRLANLTNGTIAYMGVGTGTVAAAAADTTLAGEQDRNALYSIAQGTGASENVVTYKGSWAAGDATAPLTEAGLFNAATLGTMLARQVFAVINKGASDTLDITWTVTCGA